jgi:hypothetical protein
MVFQFSWNRLGSHPVGHFCKYEVPEARDIAKFWGINFLNIIVLFFKNEIEKLMSPESFRDSDTVRYTNPSN